MKKIFLTMFFGLGFVMNAIADPSNEHLKLFRNVSGYENLNFEYGENNYKDQAIDVIKEYIKQIKQAQNSEDMNLLVTDLQTLLNTYYGWKYNYAWVALRNKNILSFDDKDDVFKNSNLIFKLPNDNKHPIIVACKDVFTDAELNLINKISEQRIKNKSITAKSLDNRVKVVKRSIFKEIQRALPNEKDTEKIKLILQKIMNIILTNANRKDVKQ